MTIAIDVSGENPKVGAYIEKNADSIIEAFECAKVAKAEHEKLIAPILAAGFTDDLISPFLNSGGAVLEREIKHMAPSTRKIKLASIKSVFNSVVPTALDRVTILNSNHMFFSEAVNPKGLTKKDDVEDELLEPAASLALKNLKIAISNFYNFDHDRKKQTIATDSVGRPITDVDGERIYVDTDEYLINEPFFINFDQAFISLEVSLDSAGANYEELFQKINKLIDLAIQNIEKAMPCMETLYRHSEKIAEITTDESITAATDRIKSDKDPAAADADYKAATAALSSPKRSGLAATLLKLPDNFREQCLFLAQIFQFAEFHRDLQMGGESETTDAQDFAARARKAMTSGVKDGEISVDKKLPYYPEGSETNSSLIIEGGAWGFINKLTQYPGMEQYFDATNAQLAHLQPMIRLFKVTPSNGKSETEQEFAFDTFAKKIDVDQILTRKEKRGFGVGIEKFSFTFHGSNPFAIKKSIKANLVIKANNFDELLRNRDGLRYIDLALKTGSAIEEKYDKSDLNFRIKACVGLSIPRGETTANFSSIKNGVRNNFATVNLTPVTHTFDFDDTGAVTFSIEYLAYIEEYFDQARMNIFADTEVNQRAIQRRLAILTQKKRCKDEGDTKSLNDFLKKDAENVKADKLKSLQFLTNQLLRNNLIYYLNLTKDEFVQLVRSGPFYNLGDIRNSISLDKTGAKVQDIAKNLEATFNKQYKEKSSDKDLKNSFKISGIESKNFAFFYLGDLIDLLLKKIPENLQALDIKNKYQDLEIDAELITKENNIISNSILQFKKFRFALGPLEIIDHKDGQKSKEISFADVPIALDYFNEWLTSKLLAKEEATYSLTTFINDLMNDFITNFLNDDSCYSYNIKQRVRMFQNVITSYSETPENDSITKYLSANGLTRLNLNSNSLRQPILSTGGYRELDIPLKPAEKEFHFFVFYAGRVQPKELMQGNRKTDHGNGIFHYLLGRDKGIVKEIKLDKTDSPASLKMVRFEQDGYDGLRQLREIYDVSISTFANLQTYPGTYIYVEPRGFSPSLGSGDIDLDKFDLTDLGIGGYYMIIESTHEFSSGVMDTNFKAKWVQSLDTGDGKLDKISDSSVGDGGVTAKKCSVRS